jgi:hypothetical protein
VIRRGAPDVVGDAHAPGPVPATGPQA